MDRVAGVVCPVRLRQDCPLTPLRDALDPEVIARGADIFVIEGAGMGIECFRGKIASLVAELHSHARTRHASILVKLPPGGEGAAAMLLDVGAHDVLPANAGPDEIFFRVQTLVREKQRQDRMRSTLRNGLMAAVQDPLTGLFNRRYAMGELEKIADSAGQTGASFATLMIDIDHFKSINDTYGHQAGDMALRQLAMRLRDSLRISDTLIRMGGEEFMVIMPEADAETATAAAERLRRTVAGRPVHLTAREKEGLTVSVGIGMCLPERGDVLAPDLIVKAADEALYRAKEEGRNRVRMGQTPKRTTTPPPLAPPGVPAPVANPVAAAPPLTGEGLKAVGNSRTLRR